MTVYVASAPGRTEIAGNHQDHQGGSIIAAGIDKRITCKATPIDGSYIKVYSRGFEPFEIDLSETTFTAPKEREFNTPYGLVRGMAAGIVELGGNPIGCEIEISSDVPPGMGVSSSAAFEVCVGAVLSRVMGIELTPLEIARIGLVAERDYFGKPCGMMDQTACALGGVNLLNFEDVENPCVTNIQLPAGWKDYKYFLVDCGEGHAHTTGDFSRVARDMEDVARTLGIAHLHDITIEEYLSKINHVRSVLGDGAALCALGFYVENALVLRRFANLVEDDMEDFIIASNESSRVSSEYLQNVSKNGKEQPAMVAQAVCRRAVSELAQAAGSKMPIGSVRIHGGGFGGTIQVILRAEFADAFVKIVEAVLGNQCALEVGIGGKGLVWEN